VNQRDQHARTTGGHRASKTPLRSRPGFWWGIFSAVVGLGVAAALVSITIIAPPFAKATPTPTTTFTPYAGPSIDLTAYSIDDPTSNWLVVDKLRPLNPLRFVPADLVSIDVPKNYVAYLRKQAAASLVQMFISYKADNPKRGLKVQSSYRSYDTQASVFDGTLTLVAKPGYSEHQTGMATDIGAISGKCPVQDCFAFEPEGKWLAANAYKFGFILRYPKGKEAVTGYQYEPWHYRFVGTELAWYMHDNKIQTLEEAFSLPPAPKYAEEK
jgi:D-alanyl-D-alanine carboxypeptidase